MTRVHSTCVIYPQVQALECPSSDVTPPAVLPTSQPASWLSKCIHGQPRIGCSTPRAIRYSYYGPASVPNGLRSNLRAFLKFPRGACPQTPPIPLLPLRPLHTHTHTLVLNSIKHPCNPPSENPGYRPANGFYSCLYISTC